MDIHIATSGVDPALLDSILSEFVKKGVTDLKEPMPAEIAPVEGVVEEVIL